MNKKLYWIAILKHPIVTQDRHVIQHTTEIHVVDEAGLVTLNVLFPNIWEWRRFRNYSDELVYWSGNTHLELTRIYPSIDSAIEDAEASIISMQTLFAFVRDIAGETLEDLPEELSEIPELIRGYDCEYKYCATKLGAEAFVSSVESSGTPEKELTLDWGEAIRELPREKWIEHKDFILTFIDSAPFSYGFWNHWKWLFKKMDEDFPAEILVALLSRIDGASYRPASNIGISKWEVIVSAPKGISSWLLKEPKPATVAYLRRFGRRFMRELSMSRPNLYMTVAKGLLESTSYFDPTRHWVKSDIIYGGSKSRWNNKSHGRGRLVPQYGYFSVDTREEFVPDKWNMELPYLKSLYRDPNTPWQFSEFAAKIILDNGDGLRDIDSDLLVKFRTSSSPIHLEMTICHDIDNGGCIEDISPGLAAFACVVGNKPLQQIIKRALMHGSEKKESSEWRLNIWKIFCVEVLIMPDGYYSPNDPYNAIMRRLLSARGGHYINRFSFYREAFLYEWKRYSYWGLDPDVKSSSCQWFKNRYYRINDEIKAEVSELMLECLPDVMANEEFKDGKLLVPLFKWLPESLPRSCLDALRDAIPSMELGSLISIVIEPNAAKLKLRVQLIEIIKEKFKEYWVAAEQKHGYPGYWKRFWEEVSDPCLRLLSSEELDVQSLCWELVSINSKKDEFVRVIWERALAEGLLLPIFVNLEQTLNALLATGNIGLLYQLDDAQSVSANLLNVRSKIYLLVHAESEELRGFAAAQNEEEWTYILLEITRLSNDSATASALWNKVWLLLDSEDIFINSAVIVNNEDLLAHLCEYLPTPILSNLSPLQCDVVIAWIEKYPQRFEADLDLLYNAASNPDLRIHESAISLAINAGLTPEFALRLLESGLSACVEAGLDFFNSLPRGDEQEAEFALILCDSPKMLVQEAGLEFVKDRWSALPITRVLGALSEHRSPHVQAFLSEQLLENPIPKKKLLEFDRHVLRERNRGRSAKEKVKERLGKGTRLNRQMDSAQPAEISSTDDIERLPVLAETARSRVIKDSDWALSLLVQASLDGEEVDGLNIDGPVGV